jgi:RNA ligase (TIGR02306 family)
VLPSDVELNCQLDDDVSSALGVTKYEPPLPAQLAGVARGPYPSRVPRTDQERVQNLSEELRVWCETRTEWEVTEKLEGASCTFMLIDGELHVCSRNLDLVETPENTLWKVARELEIEERFRDHADVHDLKSFAVQGELVGPSIQDNIYKLTQHAFYVFDIYDVERGYMLRPAERRETVSELGLLHVPVFGNLTLDETLPMDKLLEVADGSSQLLLSQPREGIVFKSRTTDDSFKVISNKYLLKQKS